MKKILIVDDNTPNLTMISGVLSEYYKVYPVDSGEMALKYLEKQHPDLILLDVDMPAMSGIDLMGIIKSNQALSDIPVIFLTGMIDTDNEACAFELGAVDYIHKPVNKIVLTARVKLHLEVEAYRKKLEEMVELRTEQVMLLQKITIDLLGYVTEFRDKDTGYHVERTTSYVTALMNRLGEKTLPSQYQISKTQYQNIIKATPLHDIGKISIPDSILLKPGSLTFEEFEIMKSHVTSGAELLQRAIDEFNGPSFLDTALEIVLTHHEKWDGSGYPKQLSGEDIPISGRVMAIADVYDALTSERPYKPAFSHEKAMDIITEGRGSHFDPLLVDEFLSIQEDIMIISNKFKTEE